MSLQNFKHINANEQIFDGSIGASLFSPNILVSSLHADNNSNLTGAVQLVSGSNIVLSQTDNVITINANEADSVAWGSITGTLSNQTDLQSALNSKQPSGNYITALTGDATASGPGSATLTLATVNGDVGTFTYPSITVNSKGLVTSISNGVAPITYLAGTGLSLISNQFSLLTPVAISLGGTGTATPSLVAGTGITITGSWPNQTVNSTGSGTFTPTTQTQIGSQLPVASTTLVESGATMTFAMANAAHRVRITVSGDTRLYAANDTMLIAIAIDGAPVLGTDTPNLLLGPVSIVDTSYPVYMDYIFVPGDTASHVYSVQIASSGGNNVEYPQSEGTITCEEII